VSKIKDMLGIEEMVKKETATMKDDLYKNIKEVAELKYRLLEAETKLNNLEVMVKIINERG